MSRLSNTCIENSRAEPGIHQRPEPNLRDRQRTSISIETNLSTVGILPRSQDRQSSCIWWPLSCPTHLQ